MINKIVVDSTSRYNKIEQKKVNHHKQEQLAFKGLGTIALSGIQACERMPMVNVAVIDMLSAILPRTIVESMTNWFAGFEAFRRESSGLFVNCILPGFFTLGIAKLINNSFIGKDANMANCWADRSFIDRISESYKATTGDNKAKDTIKDILGNIEGFDRDKKVLFKDSNVLSAEEVEKYSEKLLKLTTSTEKDSIIRKDVRKIAEEIVNKTHVSEHLSIQGGKSVVKAASVSTVLEEAVKFLKEYKKVEGKVGIEEFAKKSKNLVMAKSGLGFALILPLAISMQYINRWITGKLSGVKGAPIYDDFGKGDKVEPNPKSKEGLLKQKLISIVSMLGVSLLSMMKKPSLNMLEFKGQYPTMDQARIISTATFASRMAAADDKNELAEATVRDIATFSSLYFLGDYAAKGAASIFQRGTGVQLLNDTKPLSKDAGILKKAWHWIKDVNIKSSDEVISNTEEALKKAGKKIQEADKEKIAKEIQRAKNLRSACQVTNVGVSLALLGIVIPIFTRKNTKKKHEQDLKLAHEKQLTQPQNNKQNEAVTPLNVEYSKLTKGFRAQNH